MYILFIENHDDAATKQRLHTPSLLYCSHYDLHYIINTHCVKYLRIKGFPLIDWVFESERVFKREGVGENLRWYASWVRAMKSGFSMFWQEKWVGSKPADIVKCDSVLMMDRRRWRAVLEIPNLKMFFVAFFKKQLIGEEVIGL